MFKSNQPTMHCNTVGEREDREEETESQTHKCRHRDNESPHHTKGCGTEGYNGAFVECVERKMCRQNTTACIESIPPYHPTPAHTLTSHLQTTPNRDKGVQGITLATRKAVSQESVDFSCIDFMDESVEFCRMNLSMVKCVYYTLLRS